MLDDDEPDIRAIDLKSLSPEQRDALKAHVMRRARRERALAVRAILAGVAARLRRLPQRVRSAAPARADAAAGCR